MTLTPLGLRSSPDSSKIKTHGTAKRCIRPAVPYFVFYAVMPQQRKEVLLARLAARTKDVLLSTLGCHMPEGRCHRGIHIRSEPVFTAYRSAQRTFPVV